MNRNIYYFKDYLIDTFDHPLYRIPIDLRLGCPHKTDEKNGCVYCPEDGARAVHIHMNSDLKEQVAKGIIYANSRYKANNNFIAYFQSYTNTFANVDILRKYYNDVLSCADFRMIMISTRPDCLPDDVLHYLVELKEKYEVWIELGVQTSNNKTLKSINRKHTFSDTISAVNRLSAAGIKTSAHIIIGLPDETYTDFNNTITDITALPFCGIKFHHLQIVKNSYLGKLYYDKTTQRSDSRIIYENIGAIDILNEYDYAGILINLLRKIPPGWPVMRLMADAPEDKIIQPKWLLTKGQFIDLVNNAMKEQNYYQGELIECQMTNGKWNQYPSLNTQHPTQNSTLNTQHLSVSSYLRVKTVDGSYTFYHPTFKENYHTLAGAKSEAYEKFIKPSRDIFKEKEEINLLDIGFGLGYNAFAAMEQAVKLNKKIKITSLELDTNSLKLAQTLSNNPENMEYEILNSLAEKSIWKSKCNSIKILFGDARKTISGIPHDTKFDLIFLDAFSTIRNPELWTFDFLRNIVNLISDDGLIITYSAAFPVRGALHRNKLFVGSTEPFGRIKGGTIASFNRKRIKMPLSEKDMNIILKSTAGLAYRDPTLNAKAQDILKARDKTVHKLRNKGIPKWYVE